MIDLETARRTVADFQALLDKTSSDMAHVRVADDAWTLAEIVGHLIDSATNNHQRFARLRFGNLDDFPGYEAESWVSAQGYDSCDFALLKTLWASYNTFLLHLAAATPKAAGTNEWRRESGPLTLEFLVNDYYAHMRLHIEHYERRVGEVQAYLWSVP